MTQAWLDSLSEDWVSQPPSEASPPSQAASQNAKENTTAPSNPKINGSRIPRLNLGGKKSHTTSNDNSSNILSERSLNDINLPSSRRAPSKLSQEIQPHDGSRYASRSVSLATLNSVVRNTVNHRALSTSPIRTHGQTPEWKRRLIYGDLSLGEQRDLFTSAGVVLENIFKPPPAPEVPALEPPDEEDPSAQYEVTMSSSPPIRTRDPSTVEIHVDESAAEDPPELPELPETRSPTAMRYRRTEDSVEADWNGDQSIPPELEHNDQDPGEISSAFISQGGQGSGQLRKVSGQTDINEDFSPILISRHNAGDGRTTFTPMEVPPGELRKRLENLRRNQMLMIPETNSSPSGKQPRKESNAFCVDNTEDCERLGGFINLRRGGRSADGSFRDHLLSSALNDTSELPEESLQASTPKQFPTLRMEKWDSFGAEPKSPPFPLAPHPSPEKRRDQTQSSSGSPLKLFQPYDTFTNQTLLRRLSQFEDPMSDESRSAGLQSAEPSMREEHAYPEYGTDSVAAPAQRKDKAPAEPLRQSSVSVSQFGAGDLDGYEFDDEVSYNSNQDSAVDGRTGDFETEEGSIQGPRRRIFDITHDSSPPDAETMINNRRRQKSITSVSSQRSSQIRSGLGGHRRHGHGESLSIPDIDYVMSTPVRGDAAFEGKRPRTTPAKDPTPKRRRTLHKSDIAYAAEGLSAAIESAQLSHQQMQSIIGRKRKDARHGDMQQLANPGVLAARQLLRPRTPTPSQRSSVQREHAPFAGDENLPPGRSSHKATTPGPLAAGASLDTNRKPSIKTEDFINEANKIMAMIRSKAGLASGLASVEESESENVHQQDLEEEDSFRESTREPFSRPPSREGRPPPPRMPARQEDPEIALRLKKYEEASDMGDIISSSMRSLGLARDALREAQEVNLQVEETLNANAAHPFMEDGDIVSDPPNIRLSHNPDRLGKRSTESLRDTFPSNASGVSSGNSTNRSIPTGSSRGSDSRKVIAPQSVEHLIPDKVGNMFLDRQRNIWIKQKQAGSSRSSKQTFLPSEGSEDDPFAGIPDLTVDMTMELQNLRALAAREEQEARDALDAQGEAQVPPSPSMTQDPTDSPKPHGPASPSKSPLKGTLNKPPTPVHPTVHQDLDDTAGSPHRVNEALKEAPEEEVEHEISIFEDRTATPKRRNLTITFSSPIASIIQDLAGVVDTAAEDNSFADQSADISHGSISRGRRKASVIPNGKGASSRSRSGSTPTATRTRQISVRGQAFVPRPVSRIDEQDEGTDNSHGTVCRQSNKLEVSILGDQSVVDRTDDQRRTSLSFVVTTPARGRDCPAVNADAAPIISQYVGTFSLSPLSEFTMNHGEQSLPLEVSYVVDNHHLVTGDHARRVLSMNARDLVQKLAEVEPFEPYWEDMRELDVCEKRLESLYALDEFCGRLESLDASNNQIRNLGGIPSSVRQLRIAHNCLTSLTAWDHLWNLQYVDVSNNELTSLAPFRSLVHLRSLRADNNQLTSIDDIKYHDGLQVLRARGNAIEEVDFEGTRLHRLTELDLKGNRIRRLNNMDQLSSLDTLNLEDNQLETLGIDTGKPFASLKYLALSNNSLTSIDLKSMPNLRLLHADRNCLSQLSGFSRARRLDSLSLREQRCEHPLDLSFLSKAYEVRKLYLSGNLLANFSPQVDFLNLQLLELSNCGLRSLPESLGQMMPNLRVVNLNFNAISDLGPLRFIPRLKRVLAAGNRLNDSASVIDILAEFPQLTTVDLRDNPITQGFYAPLQVLVRQGEEAAADAVDSFTLPGGDAERDATYSRRLDLETRMRRRLYEQVFADSCGRLRTLDGLPLRRDVGELRDAVWAALATQGLVVSEDGSRVDVAECNGGVEESRWEAENSFA